MGQATFLFSQQGVSDRNINTLWINKPDTLVKSVLPHKLQPAGSHTPVDKKDSLTKAQNSISKAISSLNEGNTAMALFHIHEALNFTPGNDIKTQAIATSYYGLIHVRLGNHTKAVNAMNASDSMFTRLGDEGLLAFHYNNLGLFHQKFGNSSAAQQHFLKSLEISRNLKDYANIAITLNQLSKGEGSLMLGKTYLMEAIGINKMLDDSLSLAENFNNLANIYLQSGLYDSSKVYLLQSRAIAENKRAYGIARDLRSWADNESWFQTTQDAEKTIARDLRSWADNESSE
jgi:tetratricopeptide (TPR) repeat protein